MRPFVSSLVQLKVQPRLRLLPFAHNGYRCDADDLRRFFDAKFAEESLLDKLCLIARRTWLPLLHQRSIEKVRGGPKLIGHWVIVFASSERIHS
jgi:hypothetical protein